MNIDKVIEAFEWSRICHVDQYEQSQSDLLHSIAVYLIHKQKEYETIGTKMEWISVHDRLPERGERVLGYAVHDEDFCDLHTHYFECFQLHGEFSECIDGIDIKVTHWMPLPSPPPVETKDYV